MNWLRILGIDVTNLMPIIAYTLVGYFLWSYFDERASKAELETKMQSEALNSVVEVYERRFNDIEEFNKARTVNEFSTYTF